MKLGEVAVLPRVYFESSCSSCIAYIYMLGKCVVMISTILTMFVESCLQKLVWLHCAMCVVVYS